MEISQLGFDSYIELLNENLSELRGEKIEEEIEPEIDLGLDTSIPEEYIQDPKLKLVFYRRLAGAYNESLLEECKEELLDRFGSFPESVQNLLQVMDIRIHLKRLRVKQLKAGPSGFSIDFHSSTPINNEKLIVSLSRYPQHFKLSPDGRLFIKKKIDASEDTQKTLRAVSTALAQLEEWCEV